MVKPAALRPIFALAAEFDLHIDQMDVKTAFLNPDIDGDVYIELPDGFRKPGLIGKLKKGLYGLKQAPRLWNKLISQFLVG